MKVIHEEVYGILEIEVGFQAEVNYEEQTVGIDTHCIPRLFLHCGKHKDQVTDPHLVKEILRSPLFENLYDALMDQAEQDFEF